MEPTAITDPGAVAKANIFAALCPLLSMPIIGVGGFYATLCLERWLPTWLFLLLVPIGPLSFGPLGLMLQYFEIPILPHLGIHIGGYLPASCKENFAWEGNDSLPCTFSRLLDWLPRVSLNDLHINEIEEAWISALLYTLFCITIMALDLYIIFAWYKRPACQVKDDLELLIDFTDGQSHFTALALCELS